MKKFTVYPVLCGVMTFLFLLSARMTFASWETQGDTINKITMKSVKGQIVEEYEQNQTVYPNATINKIVQVKNTGTADALIRIKIEKAWGDDRDENGKLIINPNLSTDNIEITYNTTDWFYNQNDGYYYYKGVLNPEDTTIALFNSFTINGEKTTGAYKNKLADIIINMEMIQAEGDSLSYWGTSFEELDISYISTHTEEIITKVSFNDPNKGFSFDVNEGDLFANFKNLIPGESRSQIVEITNNWNQQVEIFLWADFIEQTQATDETRELINKLLYEYAKIIITDENGNVIYNGTIWGSPDIDSKDNNSMKYPYSLGMFSSEQTKRINISLSLDPQMDNEYKELLGLIKWVFSAQGTETDTSTDTTSSIISTDTILSTTNTDTTPSTTSTDTILSTTSTDTTPSTTSTDTILSTTSTDTILSTTSTDTTPSTIDTDITSNTHLNENTSANKITDSYTDNPSTKDYSKLGLHGFLTIISFILMIVTYKKSKHEL